METIRVSCAGLARVIINNKYLLILNANSVASGRPCYGPLGGALEFNTSIKPFLDTLNVKYEKGKDLRLIMPMDNFDRFKKWFNTRQNREISCVREIYEELTLEESIIKFSPLLDLKEEYFKTIEKDRISQRIGANNALTKGFYEIYNVEFSEGLIEKILNYLKIEGNNIIKLFTKEEIEQGNSFIGTHSLTIL